MKTFPLNLIRKFLPFILVMVVSFSEVKAQATLKDDEKTSVIYGGMENEYLIFYVKVDNRQKEKLSCQLLDENKNILFEEIFSAQRFDKKFLVSRENVNDVTFSINGKNYNFSRNFSILTRTIEEITVEEIK
ncbi:MAG: hypothetical protein JNM19_04640 [Chitinophagaceae bacterium]|nr:hypothetical protein [Chitinophagaceae bacterium]